jgi:hypothetical protein
MTKLVVAFRCFKKAPKNHALSELIAMSYRICIFNCVVVAPIRKVPLQRLYFTDLTKAYFMVFMPMH